MHYSKITCFVAVLLLFFPGNAQEIKTKEDSMMLRNIYTEALENGKAYEDLRSLCKDIGARLSGSVSAEMAVQWGYHRLKKYDFDSVYLQEVMVPHWERGTKENGYYQSENGKITKVNLLALGGSVPTNGIMSGEIIMFENRDALLKAEKKAIEGKIVFIAQPMDQKMITTFNAYGACYPIRGFGAIDAARLGAKAVIIRSLSLSEHEHPHTGTMRYEEGLKKIPAAALSTNDATALENLIKESQGKLTFHFGMDCKVLPDKLSHNVIAEIKGSENPNNIITIGGHLDSWDIGEGAHDDGAGIVHSMEALRILKELNYQPKNTLRVVFFMNEENGNMGGKTYAKKVKASGENHILAIESDRGGFSPRGFSVDGKQEHLDLIRSFQRLFKPYLIHHFEFGYGGVDIGPLKDQFEDIGLFGFVPDSQRYFDFHHNANDVFENVNKRELELGAGSLSALLYLLDRYWM
ncbi:M20/M25/M40 family metallo-hydrolase [Brumimicrobium oceani]|uniref:Carboxypeptidase Q n=1 Tax=Brumimicrobium oceani TaxID=2100725 RepID=A0A2U2XDQ6_9FLAO|nr:M20/M25/M40 family metallo-hydrolase [Brumimicrobium oceani]PWH85913.1 peptidase M28 family protein [Brumimicrobium oceani]